MGSKAKRPIKKILSELEQVSDIRVVQLKWTHKYIIVEMRDDFVFSVMTFGREFLQEAENIVDILIDEFCCSVAQACKK